MMVKYEVKFYDKDTDINHKVFFEEGIELPAMIERIREDFGQNLVVTAINRIEGDE